MCAECCGTGEILAHSLCISKLSIRPCRSNRLYVRAEEVLGDLFIEEEEVADEGYVSQSHSLSHQECPRGQF